MLLQQHVDFDHRFHVPDHHRLSNLEKNRFLTNLFDGFFIEQTDINNFMSYRRKFITETEFVNTIFLSCLFDLIVLLFCFSIEIFARWTFDFKINIIISTCDDLIEKQNAMKFS